MKFPSLKKLPLIPVLVAIFLAIGLILFINAYSKKEAFSKLNIWGGKESIIESQNKDSDNDGLQDWQEALYKTDPLNPDTDGDGYLDGEEINSGHNPLVKAPGDTQMFYPLPIGEKYNITTRLLTDETLNALFDSYFSQKTEYLQDRPWSYSASIKESDVQEMFLRAMNNAYPTLLAKSEDVIKQIPGIFDIEINDSEIDISEDNSQQVLQSYINKVSSIILSDNFLVQEKSLKAISTAFENADFSPIDALIKANDEKIEKIKNMTIPSSWKEIHKDGLRLTLIMRNIFVSFRDIENDPFKAYIALQKLDKIANPWNELMQQAIDLANQQGLKLPL